MPRWSQYGTASVAALRPMLAFARTKGVDVEALLRDVGVAPSAIDDPDVRIPESTRARLSLEAPLRARDAHFGLRAAKHAPFDACDVLDYAVSFSDTLGHGLARLARYLRVLCDAAAIEQGVEDGVACVRRVEKTPPHEAANHLALIVLRARELTARRVAPREVRFSHAASSDGRAHAALFRCRVRFACPTTELLFDARDMALPIRRANPGVGGILERYMNEIVARLPKNGSFLESARGGIAQQLLAGRPTLRHLADKLQTSPRTLQRRFAEPGPRTPSSSSRCVAIWPR